ALLEQAVGQIMAGVGLEQRVADMAYKRVLMQKAYNAFGVVDVALHAQRQRFQPLQDQPGAVRAQASTKVAQAFPASTLQKRADRGFFREYHVMKACVRFAELRKQAGCIP